MPTVISRQPGGVPKSVPEAIPEEADGRGDYRYEESQRAARRALVKDLGEAFTMAELRESRDALAQLALRQKLEVLEQALLVLKADPVTDPPSHWAWCVALPVSGRAQPKEEAGIRVERLRGGSYLETATTKGFGDLRNLYTYVLRRLLPVHKQTLTHPEIYHRVIEGLDNDDPRRCSVSVYIPYCLTLQRPPPPPSAEERG